jgi:hypothetical protein
MDDLEILIPTRRNLLYEGGEGSRDVSPGVWGIARPERCELRGVWVAGPPPQEGTPYEG